MTGRRSAPGDLGRRIARRREDLGFSREELARRAGIDPGYLAYLEESAASPNTGTVNRVATALDTRPEELLGKYTGLPPGHGPATGHPVLEKLDRDECLRLITPGGVGRIAFEEADGPVILPVNYALHGDSVIFRTAFGGPLDASLRTGIRGVECKVAFEVDRIDDACHEGWSVLVRGGIRHVSSEKDRAALAALGVRPWAGGERELYVRITATEVSGRRIRHGL
ncbi:pyridoxamine 5'-phosphate oxidase family protein [Streptosporangium amethystogenes subsp. fukuiense]|uniref:Pyridoxamine 5'-phosphate oxidase family protein n=1 Tax=Streptosporangium amethystogenes subsp. fukuiense TaxID=698418 RepID=A0ABW2SXY8_9ACTN